MASASRIILSASTIDIGNSVAISIVPEKSEYKHTLKATINYETTVIASNVATSYAWVVPESIIDELPSDTFTTIKITCETYSSGELIGTSFDMLTAMVHESIVPSITSIDVEDSKGHYAKYGSYVLGKSEPSVHVAASGSHSSSIEKYKITANGSIYNSNDCKVLMLHSGSNTITATVTDSRGRTATQSTTINVIDYANPSITTFYVQRCKQDGTLDENGGYFKATFAASIYGLNGENSKEFQLRYKKNTETSWIVAETYDSAYTISEVLIIEADVDSLYDVKLVASDDFVSISKTVQLASSFTLMDFRSNGKGIAFGKVSEKDAFECALPAEFASNILSDGDIIDGNGNSISSRVAQTDYTGDTIASLINQSADSVIIEAKHINLNGYLTISAAQDTYATQSALSGVESTANTASSNASSAVSTANSASSDASSALSTANGIASNIYTAGTTTIDGGKITTGSIDCASLKANTTISNKIYASNLNITGGSVNITTSSESQSAIVLSYGDGEVQVSGHSIIIHDHVYTDECVIYTGHGATFWGGSDYMNVSHNGLNSESDIEISSTGKISLSTNDVRIGPCLTVSSWDVSILTGGSLTVGGPLTASKIQNTPIYFDSGSLPEFSDSPLYLLGIESFANGGQVKWKGVGSISVAYATSAGSGSSEFKIDGHYVYPDYEYTIDLSSGYNQDYWYPCITGQVGGRVMTTTVCCHLDTNVPYWATHSSGFTCDMTIQNILNGWGTTDGGSICLRRSYRFATENPCGWSVMSNASKNVLWLRGGGVYRIRTNYHCDWQPAYQHEIYSQTVTATTSCPFLLYTTDTIYARVYNGMTIPNHSGRVTVRYETGAVTVSGTYTAPSNGWVYGYAITGSQSGEMEGYISINNDGNNPQWMGYQTRNYGRLWSSMIPIAQGQMVGYRFVSPNSTGAAAFYFVPCE